VDLATIVVAVDPFAPAMSGSHDESDPPLIIATPAGMVSCPASSVGFASMGGAA
jgi:hypothetical protein